MELTSKEKHYIIEAIEDKIDLEQDYCFDCEKSGNDFAGYDTNLKNLEKLLDKLYTL